MATNGTPVKGDLGVGERPVVGGFVLGRTGRPASLWSRDLGELCGMLRALTPGAYWIRFVLADAGKRLDEVESLGSGDWGFVHVRPTGGWLMGTPGLAEAVEEMGAVLGEIGGGTMIHDPPPWPVNVRELEAYLRPDPRVLVQTIRGVSEARFDGVRRGRIVLGEVELDFRPRAGFEVGLRFVRAGFTWCRGTELVQVYYHAAFPTEAEAR